MEILLYFLVFYFGAIVGSFLNVVILRLPEDQSLTGRSHCPQCRRTLGVLDLFPLFSFIFLRGRCRGCGNKISWRYFIVEAITGLLFTLCLILYFPQSTLEFLFLAKAWLVCASLITVFMIDLEHFLILDEVLVVAGVGILALNISADLAAGSAMWSLQAHTVGGVVAATAACLPFFFLWWVSDGNWMGFGDVKFAMLLGLILGWPVWWVAIFLAILLGGVVSVGLLALGNQNLKTKIPFGTFLSLATIITLFYGEKLQTWYFTLIGL